MELIIMVFAACLTLVLDFIALSTTKATLFAVIGGISALFASALLAVDNSLTIQGVSYAATTGEFRMTLVLTSLLVVCSFLISIYEDLR